MSKIQEAEFFATYFPQGHPVSARCALLELVRDWLDDLGFLGCQIFHCHDTAARTNEIDNGLRDPAFVEACVALIRYRSERLG